MKKFWSMKDDDVFIFGEIVSDAWQDSDVTAKSLAEDLNSCAGNVTLHINSSGGDILQAIAICNTIKNRGNVTISVEGLCASAATLILCSGCHVKAAQNSLFMTHAPTVGLMGFYDEAELSIVQNSMSAVKDSIITTYKQRLKSDVDLSTETWYSAKEALEIGLIDEITGTVDLKVDDSQQMLFVNSLSVSTKKFDVEKIHRAMEMRNVNETLELKYAASVRRKELARIQELQSLKSSNAAVNALVDVALENGLAVKDVRPFVEALNKIPPAQDFAALIRDQMQSGAQNVEGSHPEPDLKAMQMKRVVDFAKGMV